MIHKNLYFAAWPEGPQSGQAGLRSIARESAHAARPSQIRSRPASGSPCPVRSLIASDASIEPMTPQVAPMIGKTSGGGLGKQAAQAGSLPGDTVVAWP